MFDPELVLEILSQVLEASSRIERRFASIRSPDDFLGSEDYLSLSNTFID